MDAKDLKDISGPVLLYVREGDGFWIVVINSETGSIAGRLIEDLQIQADLIEPTDVSQVLSRNL